MFSFRSTPLAPAAIVFAVFLMPAAFAAQSNASAPPSAAKSAPVAASTADPYRDEPVVIELSETTHRMHADGTGEAILHVILRVQSEGVARQFSVLSMPYASANSTGTIDFVRVHKPDGTTVETHADEAMEMPGAVSREAPMYSDIKEKHLPVKALAMGDRLEYQFHTVMTKAEAPGQFWGAEHFVAKGTVTLKQTLTLQVPEKTYVQVWSPNHPTTPTTLDGVKTWTWTSSQTKPSARDENGKMTPADLKDPDEDVDGRALPSVAWTTFHSWAEVGDWYRSLAEPRLQPTATVRAKADELTKNAKTPQEQAEALYRFVATQIRYVSISFGIGRFQPHTPDEVLDHGYGDCKDKDTLLESLLRAKGFTTAPVLIGAGIAPVTDLPSPAVFNHAITTVEMPAATGSTTSRIWLDSTAEVAPFRVLMPVIRDQHALVIPDKAAATLVKTPADPPYAYKEEFNAEGALNKDGLMKAHMQWTIRSDNELELRSMMQRLSPSQWDESMQYLLSASGFSGKVSNTDMRQPDPAAPVRLSFDYQREKYADWENNRSLALFPTVEITTVDKDKQPDYDIDLGAPRTVEAHSIVTLPPGYRAELPDAVHVERDFTTFDKTYRVADGKVISDRKLVVKMHKLPRDRWKDYLAFQKAAMLEDGEYYLRLIPPDTKPVKSGDSTKAEVKDKVGESATSNDDDNLADPPRKLMTEAVSAIEKKDYLTARAKLEEVKKVDPQRRYLMVMFGQLDLLEGHVETARADYEEEIKRNPDIADSMALQLSATYMQSHDYASAIGVLEKYSETGSYPVRYSLALLYVAKHEDDSAVKLLKKLQLEKPDDRHIAGLIAAELYALHRYEEAAMAAKKAMDGSDDPDIINNNVYILSETKLDLPFAETQSRRSVDLLEQATASHSIEEVNNKAFAESANLTASWDTLGFILLLQGKATEAEPYLQASWFSQTNVITGNHLGQAYEALGRKGDALWLYRLAKSAEHAADAKEDFAAVEAGIARLEKAGVVASSGPNHPTSLQQMRSFHVKNPSGAEGGGTVRVQLSPDGIAAAMLASGDAGLKPLLAETKTLKVPAAEPTGSKARILRDAVVFCGKKSASCDFVFMTNAGVAVEGATE